MRRMLIDTDLPSGSAARVVVAREHIVVNTGGQLHIATRRTLTVSQAKHLARSLLLACEGPQHHAAGALTDLEISD